MTEILLIMAFVFGASVGSFLNVVILRLPAGKALTGRSHCPHCGHQLAWWELFPLLSFVLLGGKCSSCKTKISPRYFIIELAAAALFVACFLFVRPVDVLGFLTLFKFFLAVAAMIIVFMVDLEHFLILDAVIFPVAVVAGVINFALDAVSRTNLLSLSSNFAGGLLAAALAAAPFFLIWYFSDGRYMGFGDVKLALLLGLLLGWPLVFVCLFVAVILGGVVGFYLLVATSKTLKSRLPFGTFLSFAAVFCLFFGDKLLRWYLSILGF